MICSLASFVVGAWIGVIVAILAIGLGMACKPLERPGEHDEERP